jgi:hypothetical protein
MFKFLQRKPKKFMSDQAHEKNIASQVAMSPLTVEQLRDCDVPEEKFLKLEFFFYTNTADKAASLNEELSSMDYQSEYGEAAHDNKTQVVTGWTSPIQMATETVVEWAQQMSNIGFKHDAEFDGWGTNPEQ